MKIFAISIFMSFFFLYSLATPYNTRLRSRVKRTNETFSKFTNKIDPTTTNVTSMDLCNASSPAELENGRIRRFVDYPLSHLTTNESSFVTTIDTPTYSPRFVECQLTGVEPECYKKLPNGSVYVRTYNMIFDLSNHMFRGEILYICPDFFQNHPVFIVTQRKFDDSVAIASLICSCLSTICIVLHIIMFIAVKKLRNLPGYCLLSLCIALIAAYICTFIWREDLNPDGCWALGMLQMYFFLASFFWMNTMAYDVWKSIRMATSKFRLTTNRPFMVQYGRYSIYGWGGPLLIAIISIIVHSSISEENSYRLIFRNDTCWFKNKEALILYFAGPLYTILGMNVLFFVSSFYMISKAAMTKSSSEGGLDLWSRLFLSLRLASIMGFMWIFGIFATIYDKDWLWYLFSICSALQGVFIFFSFTISERARKACKISLLGRKCSITPTQSTSQQGTSFNSKS